MKPIYSNRDLAALGVPLRWREQHYSKSVGWTKKLDGTSSEVIYKKLRKLLKTPGALTAKSVAEAIGNEAWTKGRCSACDADDINEWVTVGEEQDWESATATLCRKCLFEAVDVMVNKGARPK